MPGYTPFLLAVIFNDPHSSDRSSGGYEFLSMMDACLGKRKDDCSGTETGDWPPAYTQLNLKVCPAFFVTG